MSSDGDRRPPDADRPRLQVWLGEHDACIAVAGVLAGTNIAPLLRAIERLVVTRLYRRVVLDMSSISACDEPTVRALAALKASAQDAGSDLELARPSRPARRALAAAGLDEHLSIARQGSPSDASDHR